MARYGPGDPRADQHDRNAGRPASTPSILVVDDDPAVLRLVEGVLRRAGADVTIVGSGRAALRAIADGASKPSLLLTAIDMPAMSGIELSARVTALRPGVEIVMMTSDLASADGQVRAGRPASRPTRSERRPPGFDAIDPGGRRRSGRRPPR